MSQTVRTRAPSRLAGEPADDLDGGLAISPSDLLGHLWRFFISMRTGLALILGLAVLALMGALLVQAPAGLQGDPQAYATWLDSVRPKYGGWTGVLNTLGLFSVFTSFWFKGTMVLLTTSILACSVNRAPYLWKQATHPRTTMSETFFEHAPLSASVAVPAVPDVALAELRTAFRARHFRTIVERDGDAIHVYADRFRWGPFGTVIAHLSLVLILLGVLVGSALGFRNEDFTAAIGTKVAVGNGTGLTLEARSFAATYNTENGAPSDYASDLVLYRDGAQVAAQTVRVNQPMEYGGVTFYQSFFGPSADMLVVDSTGREAFSGGVPLAWGSTDRNKNVGRFSLPGAGLTVIVVGVASGEVDAQIKPGQMQLELYRDGAEGTPIATQIVSQGQPATIAGLDFTFVRERQYTGLIVARDPGVPLVWGGALLLVLGVCLVFYFPSRRAWALIRRRPDGSAIAVGAIVHHDVGFESDFRNLVNEVKLALAGPSAS
jgi:cytochrome c biogenesis protein